MLRLPRLLSSGRGSSGGTGAPVWIFLLFARSSLQPFLMNGIGWAMTTTSGRLMAVSALWQARRVPSLKSDRDKYRLRAKRVQNARQDQLEYLLSLRTAGTGPFRRSPSTVKISTGLSKDRLFGTDVRGALQDGRNGWLRTCRKPGRSQRVDATLAWSLLAGVSKSKVFRGR
jgi:hypothetical protein